MLSDMNAAITLLSSSVIYTISVNSPGIPAFLRASAAYPLSENMRLIILLSSIVMQISFILFFYKDRCLNVERGCCFDSWSGWDIKITASATITDAVP